RGDAMRMRSLVVPVAGGLAVAASLFLAGCNGCSPSGGDGWPDRPGPKVAASFAPIQCFALNVAGDDAVVRPVMTTQGPHEFTPGPADIRMIARADLFVINGLQLDDRPANQMVSGSGNKGVRVVNLGAKLPEAMLREGEKEEHGHEGHDQKHEGHHHEHGAHDPHIWMG